MTKVALVEVGKDPSASLAQALDLIGGIPDLNSSDRNVVVKVGVFNPKQGQHTTIDVARAIIENFSQAPRIFLAESDNYRGTAIDRLQIWKELFTDRVVPYSLTEETNVQTVSIAGEEMDLSQILFKPNVVVSTHALRRYEWGTIIKNLLGLPPMKKKARFHKQLGQVLLDLYEAIGGIDLAIIDATSIFRGPGGRKGVPASLIVVGRDAVAVDTVGGALVGMKPEKMKILQEAAKRGIGETNLERIDVVGSSLESMQTRIKQGLKELKKSK